jgi:hypothetical protein
VTPPPSEPIRPIGPLDGGTYVDRLGSTSHVSRRRRRDQDDEDRDERQGSDEHQPGAHWQRPATPMRDPRAYDDHGRAADDDEPGHPHVDATA